MALVFTSIVIAFMFGGCLGALAMAAVRTGAEADRDAEMALARRSDRDELSQMFDERG